MTNRIKNWFRRKPVCDSMSNVRWHSDQTDTDITCYIHNDDTNFDAKYYHFVELWYDASWQMHNDRTDLQNAGFKIIYSSDNKWYQQAIIKLDPHQLSRVYVYHFSKKDEVYDHDQIMEKCGL